MTTLTVENPPHAGRSVPPWAVAAGFAVLVLAGLVWAKWQPYWVKVPSVAGSHSLGKSILTGGQAAPPEVSLSAGLSFAGTYFLAIWPALVAGLVIAAAVQVALPANWLARTFARTGVVGAARATALAVPSMMYTCCAAPIAVGLRRRARSGVIRWFEARVVTSPAEAPPAADVAAPVDGRPLVLRFATALAGLTLRLVPEYLVLVVALGAFRGVLFPLGTAVAVGVIGVVVLAVAGTLLPVPTGAEVAVIAAMLAVGVAGPVAAALLITLPALSLPSLLMVRRTFPRPVLAAVTAVVIATGVLTAGVAALAGL